MKSIEFPVAATRVLEGAGFTLTHEPELPSPTLLEGRVTVRTAGDGRQRFARVSNDPVIWDRFQDEAEGTQDLRTAIGAVRGRGVRIHVPPTAIADMGDWKILVREWLPGVPVPPTRPGLAKEMAAFFRQLPLARIDSYIRPTPSVRERESAWLKRRRADVFTDAYYRIRQDDHLKAAVQKGACSATDADKLRAVLQAQAHFMTVLCHHDVRLGKIVEIDPASPLAEEAELALVDAVFARHGLAFYDLAYFIIQCALEGHAALAAQTFRIFRQDPDGFISPMFDRCGFVPFAYRIAVDLNESADKPDRLRRARELLPAIVAQDPDRLQQVLETLAGTGR